ncbi:uncharacterized protein [Aegilops tauschii subsp. strangulata]|nr:uncharacterized protein LOC109785015 [Aegilops tauschii subsp. strangulata]
MDVCAVGVASTPSTPCLAASRPSPPPSSAPLPSRGNGDDHERVRVLETCQGEAPEDGVRLLRLRRRGSVEAQREQGGLLQDTDMDDYLKGCRFLPKLNNAIPGERNAPYRERLSSLENLVLIMG